jgi:DHA1 family inner membrane transport protein
VVVLAVLTFVAVLAVVPASPGRPGATIRSELGALRRPQVLLTLTVAVVGFGGMFAVYSYIAPVVTDVTGMPRSTIPLVLLAYGVGGVVGTVLGGRLADRALFRSLVGANVFTGIVLLAFPLAAQTAVTVIAGALLLSMSASVLVVCLQLRLMEVAGDAQMLGAAMNHSALNAANALGAWLGGLVIAGGLGYTAPAFVGAALSAAAMVALAASAVLRRREQRSAAAAAPVVQQVRTPVG